MYTFTYLHKYIEFTTVEWQYIYPGTISTSRKVKNTFIKEKYETYTNHVEVLTADQVMV